MPFRDDRDAQVFANEALRRECEQLRGENRALRDTVGQLSGYARPQDPRSLYVTGPATLTDGQRVLLGEHGLQAFPPWAAALLHVLTLGVSSLVLFGSMHGRLPRVAIDDPTTGRAIGLMFVPYFDMYWVFFAPLRLADRINLQFALRGDDRRVWKWPIALGASLSLLMYFIPVAWLIAVYQTQKRVNELVALGPVKPCQTVEQAGVRIDPQWSEASAGEAVTATAEASSEASRRAGG